MKVYLSCSQVPFGMEIRGLGDIFRASKYFTNFPIENLLKQNTPDLELLLRLSGPLPSGVRYTILNARWI